MSLRPAVPVPGPRPGPRPASSSSESGNRARAQIQLVPATDATAIEAADETVDKLLDDGRSPADILVLTTGDQHPWTQHELSFGEDTYWRQQTEADDVFYAHASAAQRTEPRPVVVLAVNGGSDAEAAKALPAALERATGELIVCGDPQRLRDLL